MIKSGRLSYNAVQRSILRPLKTAGGPVACFQENYDCAITEGEKEAVFSASVVMTLHAAEYLDLAFYRACNQLWSQRAAVKTISACFLWPTDTEEAAIADAVKSFASLCSRNALAPGAVTACASRNVTLPLVTLQAVGIRKTTETAGVPLAADAKHAEGDAVCSLIYAGHAGMAGIGLLAAAREAALTKRYTPGFIRQGRAFLEQLSIQPVVNAVKDAGACFYPVQEGGVLTALWNFADGKKLGLDVDQLAIPIRQETVEISEFYNINPYQLLGDGGCLIATKHPQRTVEQLLQAGISCKCIGTMKKETARIIRRDDEVRYLDKPAQEEMERLMETGEKSE